jgi:hypothetical protein
VLNSIFLKSAVKFISNSSFDEKEVAKEEFSKSTKVKNMNMILSFMGVKNKTLY